MNDLNSNSSTLTPIGSYLKNEREKKGLLLKNVADLTKINFSILELLENDDLAKLPKKTYVIGFVKSYAKVLNLNIDETSSILESSYNLLFPEQSTTLPAVNKIEEEQILKKTNTVPLFLIIISFIAIGSLSMFYIKMKNKAPHLASEEEKSVSETVSTNGQSENVLLAEIKVEPKKAEVKVEPKIAEVKVESKIAEVKVEPKIAEVKVEPKKAEVKVEPKKAEVKIEPKKVEKKNTNENTEISFKPLTATGYFISKNQSKEFLPANMKALVPDSQNLVINAIDDATWIAYKKDDDDIKRYILPKGKALKISGKLIRIFIGNANATKIYLNNSLLEVSSTTSVKSMIFPIERASEFKIPLFIFNKDGSAITSDQYLEQNKSL